MHATADSWTSHKPAGLLYGVDDKPPLGVNVLSGLQHVGLMFIYLVYPVLVAQAAGGPPEVASTMVSFTLLVGLGLNLLFRIGLRKTVSLTVQPGGLDPEALEDFLEMQGGVWGARRDVIVRAKFNLVQSIETLASSGVANGPLVIEASFDEFNLDLRVSYEGDLLELPQVRPTIEEIIGTGDGERKLAGFLLRQFADRVSSRRVGPRATVAFHFDH